MNYFEIHETSRCIDGVADDVCITGSGPGWSC